MFPGEVSLRLHEGSEHAFYPISSLTVFWVTKTVSGKTPPSRKAQRAAFSREHISKCASLHLADERLQILGRDEADRFLLSCPTKCPLSMASLPRASWYGPPQVVWVSGASALFKLLFPPSRRRESHSNGCSPLLSS